MLKLEVRFTENKTGKVDVEFSFGDPGTASENTMAYGTAALISLLTYDEKFVLTEQQGEAVVTLAMMYAKNMEERKP